MEVPAVCKSILYFEGAIEALVPAHRRGNKYAMNNRRNNGKLQSKTERECLGLIDNCEHAAEFADLMNENGQRYFAWNFVNLYYGGDQQSSSDKVPAPIMNRCARRGSNLLFLFIHAAKSAETYQNIRAYNRDIKELWGFMSAYKVPGIDNGCLRKLFRGKWGHFSPKVCPALTGEDESIRKTHQDREKHKNIIMRKLGISTVTKRDS